MKGLFVYIAPFKQRHLFMPQLIWKTFPQEGTGEVICFETKCFLIASGTVCPHNNSLRKSDTSACVHLYWPTSGSSSTTVWGKGDSGQVTAPSFPSWYTPHHHPAKWCPSSTPWRRKPDLGCLVSPASPADSTFRARLMRLHGFFCVTLNQIQSESTQFYLF